RFSRDWSSDVCSSDLSSDRSARKRPGASRSHLPTPARKDALGDLQPAVRAASEAYRELSLGKASPPSREARGALPTVQSRRDTRSEERRVGKATLRMR